jgi:hypothetical protein
MTRITAKPGTPEYEQQFEQQERESIDNATTLGLVRVASGVAALLVAALMVVWVCEPALQEQWGEFAYRLVFVLLCGVPLLLTLLFVALSGRTHDSRNFWSKKQQSDVLDTPK